MGAIANGIKDDVDSLTAMLDEMGGPKSYQNYSAAWAWAMNTPLRWMKQVSSHLGGVRNGMVLSWPSRIAHGGEIRSQFAHVTDVMPTLLERSEEHTSELQSLMRISYAVFCLKKKHKRDTK